MFLINERFKHYYCFYTIHQTKALNKKRLVVWITSDGSNQFFHASDIHSLWTVIFRTFLVLMQPYRTAMRYITSFEFSSLCSNSIKLLVSWLRPILMLFIFNHPRWIIKCCLGNKLRFWGFSTLRGCTDSNTILKPCYYNNSFIVVVKLLCEYVDVSISYNTKKGTIRRLFRFESSCRPTQINYFVQVSELYILIIICSSHSLLYLHCKPVICFNTLQSGRISSDILITWINSIREVVARTFLTYVVSRFWAVHILFKITEFK